MSKSSQRQRARKVKQRRQRLARRHKMMLHMGLLCIIAFCLLVEADWMANWFFVGLGVVVVEVA